MSSVMFRTAALATAALLVALSQRVLAHGVAIGQSASGQLKAHIEGPDPVPLPPSIFPGITGWADSEPGIASAELDEPDEDFFRLDPNSYVQFELVAHDPGIQIVTSHVWVPGETIDFGPPFFDFHLVFNIPGGAYGAVYALQFRLRDLHQIHSDSETFTLHFTPVANVCSCRGDTDADAALTAADVQSFVDCLTSAGPGGAAEPGCYCADADGNGALDESDVALFVARLVGSDSCS